MEVPPDVVKRKRADVIHLAVRLAAIVPTIPSGSLGPSKSRLRDSVDGNHEPYVVVLDVRIIKRGFCEADRNLKL